MPLILFRPSLVISKKRRIIIFTSSCAFKYVLDIPGKEMNSIVLCVRRKPLVCLPSLLCKLDNVFSCTLAYFFSFS